jgi:internalin A
MQKAFAFSVGLLSWYQLLPATANTAQLTKPIIFAQWCQQRNSVSAATRKTIDVLLKKVQTKECQLVDDRVKKVTSLTIENEQISDLRPLAIVTKLEFLHLSNNRNRIDYLQPLSGLTDLNWLALPNNRISDLRPLSRLNKLTYINLSSKRISDLHPLSELKKLSFVVLTDNQISDLQPLSSLNNLGTIYLDKNRVSDVKPLTTLSKSLFQLNLNSNHISDIQPLAALTRLEQLHIRNNPIAQQNCPIKTVSMFSSCRF